MEIEIRPAKPHEVAAFFAQRPTVYEMLKVGNDVVAMGSLVTMPDGRLWGFLDVADKAGRWPVVLVKRMRARLAELDTTVWVACQTDKFPQAPRLLRLVGLKPTDEMIGSQRVWAWQR